jgi:probable F420-dependent oxidoreductase
MKLGAIFPQTEIGNDPVAIKNYVQAVEESGYDHLLVFDHVLGAHPERFERLGFRPPYTYQTPFHEPFVLFGYLAALTTTLELVTGILILPQRQTALVAKQAAEVDVLTKGRLRLGVGIGWNAVEFEALGKRFTNRGRRVEEQVSLMRELWTQELVDFDGAHETVHQAGLNPLPVRRPSSRNERGNASITWGHDTKRGRVATSGRTRASP